MDIRARASRGCGALVVIRCLAFVRAFTPPLSDFCLAMSDFCGRGDKRRRVYLQFRGAIFLAEPAKSAPNVNRHIWLFAVDRLCRLNSRARVDVPPSRFAHGRGLKSTTRSKDTCRQ